MSESTILVATEQPQQLTTIEPAKYVDLVFEPFAKQYADAVDAVREVAYDIATTTGMNAAIKWRATFRDLRVASEKARKLRKAPILEIGKLLDSRAGEIEATLLPLETMFDEEIKEQEARKEAEKAAKLAVEQQRIAAIRARIDNFRYAPVSVAGQSSADIGAAADHLSETVIDLETYMEFSGEAQAERGYAVQKLREMQATQLAVEEAAAEAARQAEADRIEHERVAEANRIEAKRLADLAAELERQATEARAKQAEADRQAALERQRVEDEERIARAKAQAAMLAEQQAHEARMAEERAEIQRQQDEINRAKAEQERVEREAREAAERETARLAQEEADRIFAEQQRIAAEQATEAARVEAERLADLAEKARREHTNFIINGPGDIEIVRIIAKHYDVEIGDAMEWLKKFDYATADEHFATANVAANRLEKAA